jgi:DMSO reductase family type II enzyme molybdopterin subunit
VATTYTKTRLRRLAPAEASERLGDLLRTPYQYREWEDVYREAWTWDEVVKVSHARTNCISACSLDAFVKDGIVWREEQNSNYAQTTPEVPDFNPRGCPSGCAYSIQMYDPTRIKYPMKRVGERGSGQWERLSWDQALTEIADKLIDVIVEDGPECIVFDHGTTNGDNGIAVPAEVHLFTNGLGASSIDSWAGVGDLPLGLIQSWGTYMSEGTADDWFLADYIMIWIGNPNYTRPADAHFLWEARYRGAKVVSIAPDFSPSTPHADRWLNVRVGTDAALALGMVHVVLDENLHDPEFIKEQTDLPFLVRDDNKRFLRESDMVEGGSENGFYYWNAKANKLRQAEATWDSDVDSIAIAPDDDPALSGSHTVKLADGSKVKVRTVFDLLREHVKQYSPEAVAEITGVHANNIRTVAREFAAANSAMIFASWGACKHYHSDLFQRGMVYLTALTGNTGGKPGAGIKVSTWWPFPTMGNEGARLPVDPPEPPPIERVPIKLVTKALFDMTEGMRLSPMVPWLYAHDPKFAEIASRSEYADPAFKRPISEYMDEILEKRWQPVWPKAPKKPRFYYFTGLNPLRRWPNSETIRESLWKEIDTLVTCDFRLSTSGMAADYILPASGYYEKPGIKYTQSYLPYVIVGDRAVPGLYESKHEWDIAFLLAKAIQERAQARGVDKYTDENGVEYSIARIYEDLSADGHYSEGPEGEVKALDYIIRNSIPTKATDMGEQPWAKAAEQGMVKIKEIEPFHMAAGINSVMTDFDESKPTNQFGWYINDKQAWPTLTGRQQFYLDHEWFLEIGEELCVHKEPVAAGGPYPLRLNGGHTRWSQHSIFRTNAPLLRLQRGEPVAYVSQEDARARGINDHDVIRVFNDINEILLHAKVSPAVQPGEVICYHAWEGYQFPGGGGQNSLGSSPLKPTNMISGYGHLGYKIFYQTASHVPKEVAIDIEKVRE